MTQEEEILFQLYKIKGYDTDKKDEKSQDE